jgi:hypothetical protein
MATLVCACGTAILINREPSELIAEHIVCALQVGYGQPYSGNFCGVQFSPMISLQNFRGLIFADARDYAHYTLYNCVDFVGLIFMDSSLSIKNAKIGNFLLYGIRMIV